MQGRRTGANLTAGNSKSGGKKTPDTTEASPTEEPYEGKLHVGICAGGAGRPGGITRQMGRRAVCRSGRRKLRSHSAAFEIGETSSYDALSQIVTGSRSFSPNRI